LATGVVVAALSLTTQVLASTATGWRTYQVHFQSRVSTLGLTTLSVESRYGTILRDMTMFFFLACIPSSARLQMAIILVRRRKRK
jgi:hypothetical protein